MEDNKNSYPVEILKSKLVELQNNPNLNRDKINSLKGAIQILERYSYIDYSDAKPLKIDIWDKPKENIGILKLAEKYDLPHLDSIVTIHKNRLESSLFYIEKGISEESIIQVKELYKNELEIDLPERTIVNIIYSDPSLPFELNEFDVKGDTECRDQAFSALSKFYLNRNWPMIKDKVDVDVFIKELKSAIKN